MHPISTYNNGEKLKKNISILIVKGGMSPFSLWMFPRLIHVAFQIISVFDEVINTFAEPKARNLLFEVG